MYRPDEVEKPLRLVREFCFTPLSEGKALFRLKSPRNIVDKFLSLFYAS